MSNRYERFDTRSDSNYPKQSESILVNTVASCVAKMLNASRPVYPIRARRVRALTDAPSKTQILQARIAVLLLLGLFILGVAWYGISEESLGRLWRDVLDRPGGPMTFRFILQPAMAIIAALRDGIHDARLGRRPYVWALIHGVRDSGGAADVYGRESSRLHGS